MRRSITLIAILASAVSLPWIVGSPAPAGAASEGKPDFNGDGYADLAVAAQFENRGRGVVHVLYGSASGPSGAGSIVFGQDTAGVPGEAAPGDSFGAMLAFGNINGDAYDDLVVGSPFDDISGKANAGSVTLFRGSATGLRLNGRLFTDTFGPTGTLHRDEYFGMGLAMGDYDGDGDDDIAVGIPYDDLDFDRDPSGVGRVKILRAQAGGFSEANVRVVQRSSLGSSIRRNFTAGFGFALATLHGVADFDGLAIGMPEYSTTQYAVGAVSVYRGGTTGMRYVDTYVGTYGTESFFGAPLAAGDLGGDGNDDLAIGAYSAVGARGRVAVIHLGRGREHVAGPHTISATNGGQTPASGDGFGYSIAIDDDDAVAYLYVGAPGDEVGARLNAGSVFVFHSVGTGTPVGHDRMTPTTAVRNGGFGTQITLLDATNDGFDDVVVSADYDTVGSKVGVGAVYWYDSNDGNPVTTGGVKFSQDTPGVPDRSETDDGFGSTLAFL